MKIRGCQRGICAALVVFACGAFLSAGKAQEVARAFANPPELTAITFVVAPERSKVHWTLGSTLHTVHGTFAVTRGKIVVNPSTGKASGEIIVDAASGESGNDSRDKKMHREIIESGRYKVIAFRPDHLEGKLQTPGAVSAQIHGVFSLHGSDHEMAVPFKLDFTWEQWKGTAKFRVPYIAWGLKSPSNFFLKADPAVDVDLELVGTAEGTEVVQ